MTYEIAGPALLDMGIWHWMYDHPNATAAQVKEATLQLSRTSGTSTTRPSSRRRTSCTRVGIYSHMIHSFLYLPDYPLGHLIAFQIERQVQKAGNLGSEFERMAKQGNIAPDIWMKEATGAPVGPKALLDAAEAALARVK
jgi:hypothetical protein